MQSFENALHLSFCVWGNVDWTIFQNAFPAVPRQSFYHNGCLFYRFPVNSVFFLLDMNNIFVNLLATILFHSNLIFC